MIVKESVPFSEFSEPIELIKSKINYCFDKNLSGKLLYLSLDNMPMIISVHGGDYARRLVSDIIDKIETFLGKDYFVVKINVSLIYILSYANCSENNSDLSEDITKVIRDYGVNNSADPIYITTSIGSVDFPENASTVEAVIDKTFIALHKAKLSFKQHVNYKKENCSESADKNKMMRATYLKDAFLNDRLRLAFQPIINSSNGETVHYESLLRVVAEDGSLSSAGPFIPTAESLGFMYEIDILVLKMAVAELINYPDIMLSVNLSNSSMNERYWLDAAVNLLQDRSIATRLIIEITETSEARDIATVSHLTDCLKELGCTIALDDFGTGYTSFHQLKILNIDVIKIDGSFIIDILTNNENRFFVKTLLDIAKNFNLRTVAEFVEEREVALFLRSMGVDCLQGNYFSPAVNYRKWLED